MWVGSGHIILDFYGNDLERVKHRELENLAKSLRRKFNISMLEVDDYDDPERCVLGFSLVMPSNWSEERAQEFVQKVCTTLDQEAFTRVTLEDFDVYWQEIGSKG